MLEVTPGQDGMVGGSIFDTLVICFCFPIAHSTTRPVNSRVPL